MGVDGWWPDEGDPLDIRSRLVRNRMYWDGPQIDRPNERPFALHRNGYAGMQRYGAFLWSGDVYSTWETLRVHVPNAIHTSGIPYWGTDIGGFVPTREFSASCTCDGFSLPPSHPYSVRTDAHGNFGCRGNGTAARRDQLKSTRTTAPSYPKLPSCTMLTSNQSAESILNFDTACCPISTAPPESVRSQACPSYGPCGCIIQTIRQQWHAMTNIFGAKIFWSHLWSSKVRLLVTLFTSGCVA